MDIDTEILQNVDKSGRIRRRDLVKTLQELHPSDTGYSKPNLDRKIALLVRVQKLAILTAKDFKTYGIADPDTRATYLISQDTLERKNHFDAVIKDLHSGKYGAIKTALFEISLYKNKLLLDPKQLDSIVSVLEDDDTITDLALQILEEAVIQKGVIPSKEKQFIDKLKKVLDWLGKSEKYRPQVRRAVRLLGTMEDDAVIDQLKRDAPLFDGEKFTIEEYCNPVLIPVIEKNRSRLYELEKAFMNVGKEKAARSIFAIRQYALNPKKPEERRLEAHDIPLNQPKKIMMPKLGGKR
jgi:hypothetical protein